MSSTRRKTRSSSSKRAAVKVSDLFDLIPEGLLEELSDQTKVDFQVSRLTGKLMLQLLIYGILEEDRLSNRVLAGLYESERFKVFSGKGDHKTAHSSIADRLAHIRLEFFEELFTLKA